MYVHNLGPNKLGEYETQNAKLKKGADGCGPPPSSTPRLKYTCKLINIRIIINIYQYLCPPFPRLKYNCKLINIRNIIKIYQYLCPPFPRLKYNCKLIDIRNMINIYQYSSPPDGCGPPPSRSPRLNCSGLDAAVF